MSTLTVDTTSAPTTAGPTTTSPTTTSPTITAPSGGGADPHGVEPSRFGWVTSIAFLLLGFAVDLAQFTQVVGRALPDAGNVEVRLIAAGAGAVALYMMYEAGRLEGVRRSATLTRHGRTMVRLLTSTWFLLGMVATYIRLTILPPGAEGTGGFGGVTSGAEQAATWTLGPVTLYQAELPMALLMLVLYLAVGFGAFLFGLHSYRPRLSQLRRARNTEWIARRRLSWIGRRADRQAAKVIALREETGQAQHDLTGSHAATALDEALNAHRTALAHDEELRDELLSARHELAMVNAEIASYDTTNVTAHRLAAAAGANARQHARVLLHQHLGNPARTVKDADLAHDLAATEA